MDTGHGAARREHRPQHNRTGDLVFARRLSVSRFRLRQYASFGGHLTTAEHAVIIRAATAATGATAALATRSTTGIAAFTGPITTARTRTDATARSAADTVAGTRPGRSRGRLGFRIAVI